MLVSKRQAVNLTHMLFVAPLLLFVGLKGPNTPKWLFHLLIVLALVVASYHTYLFISQM